MPTWIITFFKFLGGFLIERALYYWRDYQKKKEERKAELDAKKKAHEEYLAVMRDPTKTQKEKEDAYQIFVDRTRPHS